MPEGRMWALGRRRKVLIDTKKEGVAEEVLWVGEFILSPFRGSTPYKQGWGFLGQGEAERRCAAGPDGELGWDCLQASLR